MQRPVRKVNDLPRSILTGFLEQSMKCSSPGCVYPTPSGGRCFRCRLLAGEADGWWFYAQTADRQAAPGDTEVSAQEAAERLGVTVKIVHRLLRAGLLSPVQIDGPIRIDAEEVLELLGHRKRSWQRGHETAPGAAAENEVPKTQVPSSEELNWVLTAV